MLTCKDASHLVSHSQDRPLSFRERWGLRVHLWACTNCRRFERQIGLIRLMLRKANLILEAELTDKQIPVEARKRINRALADQQKSH